MELVKQVMETDEKEKGLEQLKTIAQDEGRPPPPLG